MVILKKRILSPISRKKLFEISSERSLYKSSVDGLIEQIAQNWCLCMYCKLHRPDLCDTYLHWRGELETHLNTLSRKKLKTDKYKATKEVIVKENKLDNPDNVLAACRVKFFHENSTKKDTPSLGISLEHQKEVCTLFSEHIEDIINCISSSNNILEYTLSVFPDLD